MKENSLSEDILNKFYLKTYGVDLDTYVADHGVAEMLIDLDLVDHTKKEISTEILKMILTQDNNE